MTQCKRRSHAITLVRQAVLAATVVTVFAAGISASASAETVTNLTATHRGGQTFLTFKGVGSEGDGKTYSVYRHTAQISMGNIGSLTPIATLDQRSGRLLYDDNPTITYGTGQNLKTGFIISDSGPHLANGTGLLVWTTSESGTFYYAVTNSSDKAISVGTNSLANAVSETYQTVPGAVLLSVDRNYGGSGRTVRHYYAWEDYSTWRHTEWGYYGHSFIVALPMSGSGPYDLSVPLHSAVCGFDEPLISPGNSTTSVVLAARDLSFCGSSDPYTGTAYGHSKWIGRLDTSTGLYMTVTANRVVRYTKLLRDDALGDGFNFEIDRNRLYIFGGSLGSNAMHIAAHHSDLYAAAEASVGMVNDDAWNPEPNNTTVRVNGADGETIAQYRDLAYQAAQHALVPIIHTPNQNDGTVNPAAYPAALKAFETHHQPYVAQWKANNHGQFSIAIDYPQWQVGRFKKNEAYPAFGNAGTSDTLERTATWKAGSVDPNGQRNGTLDWGSELHPIGAPIEDTVNSFGITLKSVSVDTSADVTIRNAQEFRPKAGQTVDWRNELQPGGNVQSGSVVADAQGLVTVRVQVTTGGNRLTLSCSACTPPAAVQLSPRERDTPAPGKVAPPSNVRIVRP